MKQVVVYIHGKGGSPREAEHYRALFPDAEVLGFAYQAETPWEALSEFREYFSTIKESAGHVAVVANSIGAFFTLCALQNAGVGRAWFISPIVNMEALIENMIKWAGVTEEDLKEQGTMETAFGETLSWEYLTWVREHPVKWNVPTSILYGSNDHLQSIEAVSRFAEKTGADLTVMEGGEHWFHTEEQMAFLDRWIPGTKDRER